MFTVVIPTFNRPELLRVALTSVSKQTCVKDIHKVIVSENGLNKNSGDVCKEFDNLNIVYAYQEKQLPVGKHLQWLMSQEKDDFVALLCDDDWWDINHLLLAKQALSHNKSCVAYFSNFAYSQSVNSLKGNYYNGVEAMHLGKHDFINYAPVVYCKKDIYLFSLIVTPFHFSSMICRGDILSEAVSIFAEAHPTYYDRILYPVISNYGNMLFNPLKTAIILHHENMDSNNYSSVEWKRERQEGSLRVMTLADRNNIDLKAVVNEVYSNSLVENKPDAYFLFRELRDIFYQRENISWFKGVNLIHEYDEEQRRILIEQNSVKRKVKNKVRGIIKRLGI